MNIFKKFSYMLLAGTAFMAVASCSEPDDEITSIDYANYFRPTEFEAKVQDQTSVELSWENIQIPPQYQFEFYTDDQLTNLSRTEFTEPTTKKGSVVFEDFRGNTSYYVRVRAYSESKTSEWVLTTFTTKTAADLKSGASTDSTITVSWKSSLSVTHLTYCDIDSTLEVQTITLDDAAKSKGSYTIGNLAKGTTYSISLYDGEYCRGTRQIKTSETQESDPGEEPGSSDPVTLIHYEGEAAETTGITLGGSTIMDPAKKIHMNTEVVNAIALKNSYTTESVLNGNYITLSVDGGFKAGDVITIAGFFNNSDETKLAAADIFVPGTDGSYTVLYTTAQMINGRTVNDDPVQETYTLTADAETLCIGRNGNTQTNITYIDVTRPAGSGSNESGLSGTLIEYDRSAELPAGVAISGSTQMDPDKKIHMNTEVVNAIALKNSYTTESVLNGNCITLTVDGGFKTGDVITIAGFFNNSDETKLAAADIYVPGTDGSYTVLYTTAQMINGRTVNDDPVQESYTLTADAETLCIGRNGNTQTNIVYIKVTR